MARRLSPIAFPFAALLILVLLFSVVGYLGRFNLYLEATTNFKHLYLLLSLFPFIFFGLTRSRIWWVTSLVCLLLNLVEVAPWYVPNLAAAPTGKPVRLFLFNVLHHNTQYADAIALVEQENPTIAVFLEVTDPWPAELDPLAAGWPYHFRADKLQIEIYSQLPLKNPAIQLYGRYRGLVLTDIEIAGQTVAMIAAHAYPQLYFGQEGFIWRNQQLEQGIGEFVGNIHRNQQPVLLLGDLNATMWSPHYKAMMGRSGLKNARTGRGIFPTLSARPWFGFWLSTPVDHCLVSPGVGVTEFRTGPPIGSDHLPVIVDVVVPAET